MVCPSICSPWSRLNGDKEVWRRLSGIPEHDVDESDVSQREVYGLQSSGTDSDAWTDQCIPFRSVYPTLIVAAYDRTYLWDIPSSKLIEECQLIIRSGKRSGFGLLRVGISRRLIMLSVST